MRLRIGRKTGIRLYYNRKSYIKVHNVLLFLLVIGLVIFIGVNFYKGLTHKCKCEETVIKTTLAENKIVESVEDEKTKEEPVTTTEEPKKEYTGVCAQYYDMVDKYDWDTEVMLAIMYAESNCRPNLDNSGLNKNGSVDYGLFQINSVHGYSKEDLMDPEFNIKVAYKIYKSQGLKAWSVYKSGKYLQYLNK